MRALVLALLVFTAPFSAANEEGDYSLELMLKIAELRGMCGSIGQLARFQAAAQFEGGEEFVQQFMKTEAERHGMSYENLSDQCVSVYGHYRKIVEGINQPE